MQRILRLLATQVIFTKTEVCLACEPILKPSVFFGFSCEPKPYSKMLIKITFKEQVADIIKITTQKQGLANNSCAIAVVSISPKLT